jgi:lysophospholipase L1-like esterase
MPFLSMARPKGGRPLSPAAWAAALVVLSAAAAAIVAGGGTPATAAAPSVLVVGDSLAVGMRPYLGRLLPGREIIWDARSGRTTPQGLERLRLQLRHVIPRTVVVSLGTNDGPDPRRFSHRVRQALKAIPAGACVVWAALFRPARKGPYHALNRVLRAETRRDARLVIVDWDRAVAQRRVVLPDGLHPDAAGYRHRSSMFARAVGRCAA